MNDWIRQYYRLLVGIGYFAVGSLVVFGVITHEMAVKLLVLFLGAEKFAQHVSLPTPPTDPKP